MKANFHSRPTSRKRSLAACSRVCAFTLALIASGIPLAYGQSQRHAKHRGTIPIPEFSRLVREFSEPGGIFQSDNFTSNEISYLHVTGELKELGVSGGAYIGVGPEQNFTYIAKIRPRIAFIVDIRRQAVVQHLLYKAIFHLAKDRAQFLSLLFSRPLPKKHFDYTQPIQELLDYISEAPTTNDVFQANLAAVRRTITEHFRLRLSPDDMETLDYLYKSFWHDNLNIGFRFGTRMHIAGYFGFPTLRELILATDRNGKRGNFLVREEDYEFVRRLQEQNRIIPIVGDFAGPKALNAVAEYLLQNRYTVSAFYTSNVEEYLYDKGSFGRFADNVRKLPVSDRSMFIRMVRRGWAPHSFWAPNDRMTVFLQKISVFLQDYQAGLLPNYRSLVTTDYIGNAESLPTAAGR